MKKEEVIIKVNMTKSEEVYLTEAALEEDMHLSEFIWHLIAKDAFERSQRIDEREPHHSSAVYVWREILNSNCLTIIDMMCVKGR